MTATMPRQVEDLTGKKFNRWKVLHFHERRRSHTMWWCRCHCGTERSVWAGDLKNGGSKSCGCWNIESSRRRATKHGGSKTRLYEVWQGIMKRCYNKRCPAYPRYGGKGIRVHLRWHSFANFAADVGQRPSSQHTIDRFPNQTGDYSPTNWRWATWEEQARNRTNNVKATYAGVEKLLIEWCEELDLVYISMYRRIFVNGWTVERAFTTPIATKHNWHAKGVAP